MTDLLELFFLFSTSFVYYKYIQKLDFVLIDIKNFLFLIEKNLVSNNK